MTVVVKYVVERNGEEKMVFTSKAEADAYDKMLDIADAMFELLAQSNLVTDESLQEDLSLYLAENKEEVLYALGAKKRPSSSNKKASNKNTSDDESLASDDEDQALLAQPEVELDAELDQDKEEVAPTTATKAKRTAAKS